MADVTRAHPMTDTQTLTLSNLELEVDGERIGLSLPDSPPARMRVGDMVAFGFALTDLPRLQRFINRRGTLFDENGVEHGHFVLRKINRELAVAMGELSDYQAPSLQF